MITAPTQWNGLVPVPVPVRYVPGARRLGKHTLRSSEEDLRFLAEVSR